MARTKAVIKAQIIATISGIPIISQLVTNPSQVQYNNNFIDIVARAINFLEQLMDVLKSDMDDTIKKAAVGSSAWLQAKCLEFQYDATVPQVVEVDSNFAINYPTIDPTKRIITRCAVKRTGQRVVLVNVAKSDPPAALSGPELSAFSGYLDDINPAGVNYIAASRTADKLFFQANIYYNGQYAATISDIVIAAINDYLANIAFNGDFKLSSIVDYIQGATGVTDVVLQNVAIRADATAFADKTYLVQGQTTLIPIYSLYAGYVVEETTSGASFADLLTFTAQ